MEQRSIRLDAHNVRYRHSDAEGTENPLYHNKSCSANSIIESGVAEEDSSEQTVNGIGFQVICGCCYYFRVGGENTCQDSPWKKVIANITIPTVKETAMP